MSNIYQHTRRYSIKLFISALFLLLAVGSLPAQADDILWGVNGHPINHPVYADCEKQFEIMHQNHLITYRFEIPLAEDSEAQSIAVTRELIPLAKKWGIILRPVLQVPFTWGDRTDAGHYPAGDMRALYQQGYNRTYNFVRLFKDDIQDWEMENEINLVAKNAQGERLSGYGWTANEFDMPTMQDWGSLLKGMSDAIGKVNSDYGAHLRRILGTTLTNFGFLDYMQSRGVNYEVIGFHYYVPLGQSPYAAWSKATPRFDLFKKLASFGKPVQFNEVNAAEIYDKDYGNQEDDPDTQKGYKSLNETLAYLKNQKEMNLEEVDAYELLDEPEKKVPENRFGLMYDLNTPKTALGILSRYSAPTP